MIPFIRSVQETISRHRMLTAKDRVLAGVSGGADSTALLLALRELGYDVAAAHLNHGLRDKESDEDEAFVRVLAANLGVPCFTRSVKIDSAAGNIEAAGREARKDFLQALVSEHRFTKVALAHNREDRVETFFLHLMRGAGTEGLISMAPVVGTTVRPLIELSRADIEGFLQEKGQIWRTDRTNFDISFARNRIRQKILPELASLFNTQLVDTLSRTISILEDENQWMQEIIEAWLAEYGRDGLEVGAMQSAPLALTRRLIRETLRREGRSLTDITFDHVEAVRGLAEEGKSGKMIQLPGGVVAAREFNRLVFRRAAEPSIDFEYELPVPGSVRIPELDRVFQATTLPNLLEGTALNGSPDRVLVDGSTLGACVKIRNWKPGDYYKPAGWPAGKVKKLFQRARVPRSQRGHWPIIVTGSTIIWVTSFPVSREFTPSASSKKIVAFEALAG